MFFEEYDIISSDLDPTYGHLHHAKSLLFLERARLSFLNKIGYSAERLIAEDLFAVISSISINYLREVKNGKIRVTCEELKIKNRTLIIGQKVVNERGKTAIEATVHSMLLSKKAMRAVTPPQSFIDAFVSGG